MVDTDPSDVRGLPDPGGLNIDYQETIAIEPTEDQLESLQADIKAIAEDVRSRLTHEFDVTARLDRTDDGLNGHVLVELPTGDVVGPGIPITADRFDGADQSDWNGPIPPDEIETLSRQITMTAVSQWAEIVERLGGGEALPAS